MEDAPRAPSNFSRKGGRQQRAALQRGRGVALVEAITDLDSKLAFEILKDWAWGNISAAHVQR